MSSDVSTVESETDQVANQTASQLRVEHFTVAERAARGKAARAEIPRSAHSVWEPAPIRRDPVELLEEQARTRLPELVPIRYGRMLDSPFAFFRGGAYVMAADLAAGTRTGLLAQLCGDAHLTNFGVFASPDRRLVFSISDFDETLPGPFEWDVKRLAASFAVAGRDRGFDERSRRRVVMTTVREYREAMANFATMRNLDVWYTRLDVEGILERFSAGVSAKQMKRLQSKIANARTKDSMRALSETLRLGRRRAPNRRRPSARDADRGRAAGGGAESTWRTRFDA